MNIFQKFKQKVFEKKELKDEEIEIAAKWYIAGVMDQQEEKFPHINGGQKELFLERVSKIRKEMHEDAESIHHQDSNSTISCKKGWFI